MRTQAFSSSITAAVRDRLFARWRQAVQRSLGWAPVTTPGGPPVQGRGTQSSEGGAVPAPAVQDPGSGTAPRLIAGIGACGLALVVAGAAVLCGLAFLRHLMRLASRRSKLFYFS